MATILLLAVQENYFCDPAISFYHDPSGHGLADVVKIIRWPHCNGRFLAIEKPAQARGQPFNSSGAGEGNRTLVVSLEGFRSTIELRPRNLVAGYSVRRRIAAVTTRVGWVMLILLVVLS